MSIRQYNCKVANPEAKPGKETAVLAETPPGYDISNLIKHYKQQEEKFIKNKPRFKVEYTDENKQLRSKWMRSAKHKCIPADVLAFHNLSAVAEQAVNLVNGERPRNLKETEERKAKQRKVVPSSLGYFGQRTEKGKPNDTPLLHIYAKDIVRSHRVYEHFRADQIPIATGSKAFDFDFKQFNKMSTLEAANELRDIDPVLHQKLLLPAMASKFDLSDVVLGASEYGTKLVYLTLLSKGSNCKTDEHHATREEIRSLALSRGPGLAPITLAMQAHVLPKLAGYKDKCHYDLLPVSKQNALKKKYVDAYQAERGILFFDIGDVE